jgi:penicillin-binding protein 1A
MATMPPVLLSRMVEPTCWDKNVQKTLQDRIDNGDYYKNDDQQVGSTILDSKR